MQVKDHLKVLILPIMPAFILKCFRIQMLKIMPSDKSPCSSTSIPIAFISSCRRLVNACRQEGQLQLLAGKRAHLKLLAGKRAHLKLLAGKRAHLKLLAGKRAHLKLLAGKRAHLKLLAGKRAHLKLLAGKRAHLKLLADYMRANLNCRD